MELNGFHDEDGTVPETEGEETRALKQSCTTRKETADGFRSGAIMENVAAGTSAENEHRASNTFGRQRLDSLKKNRPRRFSLSLC